MRFMSLPVVPAALFKGSFVKGTFVAACLGAGVLMSQLASATTVQFQTVLGDFEVNLYDNATPKTVENFLAYVNANAYDNTVIHRTVNNFIVQGGAYKYVATEKLESITPNETVVNEPFYSNVRATIAMAKIGNQPNSATNQWFINLKDNSASLDPQNGGFTVFGEVTSGMEVVLEIAKLNRFNFSGALEELPLRNYSATDYSNKKPATDENFMLVEKIVVLNADKDTAASLNPPKNTLISESTKSDGGSSGSFGLFGLLALGLLALGRKTLLNKA
jgi:peptidyl-prolyl cis-trans isomerase A (cyclophilin A)